MVAARSASISERPSRLPSLDAIASVPGTFVYSPPAGTIIGPGTDLLSAVFTPADTADYKTVSATTDLTVVAVRSLPTSSPTTTPTSRSPTSTPAAVIGEQPVFDASSTGREARRQGPLSGFTLDFGTPLDPTSAGNAANYQVDTVTTKKVKKKTEHVLHPITNFTVSYGAASDAVTIDFESPETFPTGGQVTVLSGVAGGSGGSLSGPTVFAISKRGKAIVAE